MSATSVIQYNDPLKQIYIKKGRDTFDRGSGGVASLRMTHVAGTGAVSFVV